MARFFSSTMGEVYLVQGYFSIFFFPFPFYAQKLRVFQGRELFDY